MKVGLSGESSLFALISGFTITEEFNETLDNATIKFRANHRLNIKPYDEVCFESGHCMLVDNFVETQESLITEQYLYTVNLMSLTKLLEKIQLPNRVITHSLVSGQKTIYEYIVQYVEIYAPKIRVFDGGVSWDNTRLIIVDLDTAKYSVKCRDLQFSKPTLRQALTTLMLQVGCIPVLVKDTTNGVYKLQDIDFRTEGNDITQLDNYCNYITRSNASDSYVNKLITLNENVLDEGLVSNEIVGFRDTNNVFLKQKENLKLTTKFPIYKVNELILNVYANATGYLATSLEKYYRLDGTEVNLSSTGVLRNVGFNIVSGTESDIVLEKVLAYIDSSLTSNEYELVLSNVVINECVATSSGWKTIKSVQYASDITIAAEDVSTTISFERTQEGTYFTVTATMSFTYNGVSISGINEFAISYRDSDSQYIANNFTNLHFLFSEDITPLCVEYSKRQLLDTDFLSMGNATTIEELAQYIYGTVGYKIGTNVIEGFSQTYDKVIGWWNSSYTYIENIYNVVKNQSMFGNYNAKVIKEMCGNAPQWFIDRGIFSNTSIFNGNLFSNIFFSIKYQALNKLKLDISKDGVEINIPIEQYDSSENSITNANDLAQVEQQKVDRLGNDLITINQRIPLSANETGYELNDRILGEYIIFKKEMQYNPYDIQIVYTASKDYVLQNFFTAIQTKYRAYEYIDYGEAVLRQENIKINVLLDNFAIYNANTKMAYIDNWKLISALWNTEDYADYKLQYIVKPDQNYGYKNDLSIITTINNILLTSIEFDSVSHGVYISSSIYDDSLGGLPQQWYIKSEQFMTAHNTYFVGGLPYFSIASGTTEEITEELNKAYNEPRIEITGEILNSINTGDTIYYLDQQELLNQTVQFEYFTTSTDIKWTNLLQELCFLVNDKKYTKVVYFDNDINVTDQAYAVDTYYENIEDYVTYNAENNNIRILWSNIPSQYSVIKFGILENGQVRDIMSIGNSVTFMYVSLLDEKTTKVASIRNGCLVFDEYEIAKNNVNKIVNRL